MAIIEGRNPVIEAIKNDREIEKIMISNSAKEGSIKRIIGMAKDKNIIVQYVDKNKLDEISTSHSHQGVIANVSDKRIIGMAKDKNIIVQYVDKNKLDEISTSHSHQGVIANVSDHKYWELDDLIDSVKSKGEEPFFIILDEITDPHNLGSIIRTADAVGAHDLIDSVKSKGEEPFFIILDEITDPHNLGSIIRTADAVGAHGVIIPKRRSVHITPVVVKASAGATEYVPVCKVTNIVNTIKRLKDEGLWIAAADMDGQTFYEQNLTGALGLVIGSEGFGISRLVKQNCDFTVKMPMIGNVTSLNASVAGGILLYEIFKQRSGVK